MEGQCPVIEFLKAYFSPLFIKFTYGENFPGFPVIACILAHRPIFVILLHKGRLAGVRIILGGFAQRSIGTAYLYTDHFAGRGVVVRSRLGSTFIVDCCPVECQRVTAEFLIAYHPLLLVKFPYKGRLAGVRIILGGFARHPGFVILPDAGNFSGRGIILSGLS